MEDKQDVILGGCLSENYAELKKVAEEMADACQSFMDLFRESDMRPEDECYEIDDLMESALDKFNKLKKDE